MLEALFLFIEKNIIFIILLCLAFVAIMVLLYFCYAKKYKFKSKIYNLLVDSMPSGVFYCIKDDVLTLKYFNDNFLLIIGYTKEEMQNLHNNKLINIISREDIGFVYKSLYEQLFENDSFEIKLRLIKKDGKTAWVLWRGHKTSNKKREYLNCVVINITENVDSENRQRIDEERYRIIAESSDSVIFEYNIKEKTVFYTHKYKYKFGEDPITENVPDAVIDSGKIHNEDLKKFLTEYNKLLYGKPSGNEDIRIKKASGEYIWCQIRYTSIFDESGKPIRAIGKIIDIDKQKKETENLIKANQLDSFTGLYNKIAILKHIENYISENMDRKHALFFIDIDNFKAINDTYGHLYGDKILIEISNIIKNHFRYTDLVGRIGGDEFLVLLKDYIDEDFISEKAEALLKSMNSIRSEGKEISVTSSIGITVFPKDGNLLDTLYEKADIALYAAKNEGKNRFKTYSLELNDKKYLKAYHGNFSEHITFKKSEGLQDYTGFLIEISNTLYNSDNLKASVNNALKMLGQRYGADRVYIFEFNFDNTVSNTFEWCTDNGFARKNKLQKMLFNKKAYEQSFNDDNIYYCQNVLEVKDSEELKNFDLSNVSSFLQCKMLENENFKGFIGYDVSSSQRILTREEIETLAFTAKTLSIILDVKRLKEINNYDVQEKRDIINGFNFPAYIADCKNYDIIYINDFATKSKKLKYKTGDNLFSSLCSNLLCDDCKIKQLEKTGDKFKCDKNNIINSKKIIWENDESAILVCCKRL